MPKVKAGGGGESAKQTSESTEKANNVFGNGPDNYIVTVKPDETVTVIIEE